MSKSCSFSHNVSKSMLLIHGSSQTQHKLPKHFIMNPQYTQYIRTSFRDYGQLNIFTYIPWHNQPEQIFLQQYKNKSLDYLRSINLLEAAQYYYNSKGICLFEMKSTEVHMHLLGQLSQLFKNAPLLLCWKCQITERTLSKIDPGYWEGKTLYFVESNIQNIMSESSFQNIFSRLQFIKIASDPIGNTGIKKLMSHRLDNLTHLVVGNTQCTSDAIRLLKKKSKSNFRSLEILLQQKFNHIWFYRECTHYKVKNEGQGQYFQLRFLPGHIRMIYLGHLSKIIASEALFLTLTTNYQLQNFMAQTLISEKIVDVTKQFVNWNI